MRRIHPRGHGLDALSQKGERQSGAVIAKTGEPVHLAQARAQALQVAIKALG
jgi:hypothetical protein